MNSSGIKRGLATTAVSALAVAGIPFIATSASADSLAAQQGAPDGVTLYTPEDVASAENDGSESTVHLVATGGSDVQQVRFEYSTGGAFIPIATVSRSAGAFSTEWTPPPSTYNTTVDVRAVALNSVGTEIGTPDVNDVLIDPDADAIDIAYAPGANVGVFQQPYAGETQERLLGAVAGTTSDLTADPSLSFISNEPAAAPTVEDVAEAVATGDTVRDYSAPVDFTGYNFTTGVGAVNESLILAQAEAEDAESVNLYRQTITTVNATVANPNVQGANTTSATVTVLDQNGNAVVGAQVVREDTGAIQYTNSQGRAVFTGLTGSANGTQYAFFVNTDDTDGFQNDRDFRRTVTVGNYVATPTTITTTSADGLAFDVDENDSNDLRARVLDQNGNPIENVNVSYTLSVQLFPVTSGVQPANPAPVTGTVATDAQGFADIPFTDLGEGTYTLATYINQDGTPGQGAGDLSAANLVFKAGDANLVIAEPGNKVAGTTATFDASLTLDDGTPLPGRAVRFTYTANGDDVVVAAQAAQPAGTTRVSNTQADDTTDANGIASVALSDPANTPPRSELDGTLDADSMSNPIGNAGADAADVDVNFVTDAGPAGSAVTLDAQNAVGKPGVALSGSGQVLTDNPNTVAVEAVPAAGVLVTLSLPEGSDAFFTDGTYEDGTAIGDESGDLTSLGRTITVISDGNGEFTYQVAVERSEQFDNDGLAEFIVTAAIAGSNDTEDYDFSSANPLNGGDVVIELAADRFQESGVLPEAPTTDDVAYDVSVTDQFGNPVGGADVDITADGGEVIDNDGADDGTITTDFNDNVEFSLSSDTEQDVTPTGTWSAPRFEYVADGGDAGTELDSAAVADENVVADGPTAEFYEVDFAASSYTLSQNGAETVPVGSTVIMTYTAEDQNGEPIEFFVDFFRTGPDNQQGGEANSQDVFTGEDGQATYVFAGTAEGTATVTAIASEDFNGEAIPASQVTDTVAFGPTGPTEKMAVTALIAGDDNGGRKDVVRFQVDDEAEGATVRLFKIKGKRDNRRLQQVRQDLVPQGGELTFKIADRNGNRVTRFVAKVSATDTTLKAKSNTQKIR